MMEEYSRKHTQHTRKFDVKTKSETYDLIADHSSLNEIVL
jgi:hypothetical protein